MKYLSIFIATLFVGTAISADVTRTSIQSCAALLPSGEIFSLELRGTIDTTEESPVFRGNLALSNGADRDLPRADYNLGPFVA